MLASICPGGYLPIDCCSRASAATGSLLPVIVRDTGSLAMLYQRLGGCSRGHGHDLAPWAVAFLPSN